MRKYVTKLLGAFALTLLIPSVAHASSVPIIDTEGNTQVISVSQPSYSVVENATLPTLPLIPTVDMPIMPNFDESNQLVTQPSTPIISNPIERQEFAQATMTSIHENAEKGVITLNASSPITDVNYFTLEENRLVIDVANSTTTLANQPSTLELVTGIRIAAQDTATRFVLDMPHIPDYVVNLSEDRTQIHIQFQTHPVTISVMSSASADADSINIYGTTFVNVVSYFGEALIIEVPMRYLEQDMAILSELRYLDEIVWGHTNGTLQIVASLKENVSFHVAENKDNDSVTISVFASTVKNIEVDRATGQVSLLNAENRQISAANINIAEVQDQEFRSVFILDGDYSEHFGHGQIMLFSDRISTVEVLTHEGVTYIILNNRGIAFPDVQMSDNGVVLRSLSARDIYDFVVVLDPGHGGSDPGAIQFGYRESDLVLAISSLVYDRLGQNANVGVFTTRNEDVFISLTDRADFANALGADLFVSIHLNSFTTGVPNGTEVYYLARDDEQANSFTRRQAADIFQRNLVSDLGTFDRGVRTSNLSVLRNTQMPSVLLEIAFMSNQNDIAIVSNPANHPRIADSITKSIMELVTIGR